MTLPKKEDYIFYQGEKFQVEFYFTETGEIPAKEYLEKESLGVQVKLEKAKNVKKTYTNRLKEGVYYE
jgi:hypothetical protein